MARRRNKQAERIIARRRIRHLFQVARSRLADDEPVLAQRSVALARRVAMRYQTGLGPEERDSLCRECGALLVPGATARVRLRHGSKRITCLSCGHTKRRGYVREQKARRQKRVLRVQAQTGESEDAGQQAVVPARGGGGA